jgi:hypothetical protein
MDMPVGSFSFPKTFKVSWLPDYMDQLNVNSCGSFAFAVILACIWHKHYGEDVRWSTGFTYGNRRMTEYKDEGVIMRDFIKTVTHYGNVKAALWDNNFEVPKAIEVFEAAYPYLAEHAKKLVKGYVNLRDEDEARAHLMKYGIPLFACAKMKNIHPLSKSDGYHALAVVGWEKTGEFLCRNSWGKYDCPDPELYFNEFAKGEVWGVIPMEKIQFSDVAESRWSAEAIYEAAEAGLVEGFPDGTFAPDAVLTREQMAVICSRIMRYIKENTN